MTTEVDQEGIQVEQNLELHMRQLEDILKQLEDTNCPITTAIDHYTEGMKLALECRRDLNYLSRRMMAAREDAFAAFKKLEEEEAAKQAEWQANHRGTSATWNVSRLQSGLSMGSFDQSSAPQPGIMGAQPPMNAQPPMGNQPSMVASMGSQMNDPMNSQRGMSKNQTIRPTAPHNLDPNEPFVPF